MISILINLSLYLSYFGGVGEAGSDGLRRSLLSPHHLQHFHVVGWYKEVGTNHLVRPASGTRDLSKSMLYSIVFSLIAGA